MLKIKKGDRGIKVNVTHNGKGTVNYQVDNMAELPLFNNSYFVIDETHTQELGTHTVQFTDIGEDTHITSFNMFKFQVI
jgi:hypothetical protein